MGLRRDTGELLTESDPDRRHRAKVLHPSGAWLKRLSSMLDGEKLLTVDRSPITKYAMYAKLRTAAIAASIIGAGVFAIALVSGLLYEQAQRARDRERFPQIGRSVDIGGRTLNLYCSGAGQPAVIFERGAPWTFDSQPQEMFENGAPRPGYGWVWIQRELAKTTKACWYDRAGSGWSDPGPYPRDSASQARDLHALLQRAGVTPPYVLVAESSAALDAHVYAGFYPADVAGLVFVNGVHPDLLIKTRPGSGRLARFPGLVGHSQDAMAQVFNQLGLYRLGPNRPAPAPPPKGMTSSEWNTIWHLTQSSKARSALIQDIASWAQSTAEARTAGSLGDRPLIVLSAKNTAVASEYHSVWMELQTDLARLSARGRQVILNESNGELIYQAPDAVVEAARQVLGDVRRQPEGLR
jgi:pimeloyl-ACP methyl ester carboxylesterase